MKSILIILLIGLVTFSCDKKNDASTYYESGNLKTDISSKPDSLTIETTYYDNREKKIYNITYYKRDYDSLIYFYENGKVFKRGLLNKNGQKIKQWRYYTKNGTLSEMREFMIIKKESEINRNLYFNKRGDTMMSANTKFNKYDQDEFREDTISGVSNYAYFQFYDERPMSQKVTIDNPFKAIVYLDAPFYRNSEIMVLLAKEENNFNEDFSNFSEVKCDTFYCVKKDKKNSHELKDSNQNLTAVFGRRFKTTGKKILRGYVREYYTRDLKVGEKFADKFKTVTNERKIYFEKKVVVH